jgi:hypothetical protein
MKKAKEILLFVAFFTGVGTGKVRTIISILQNFTKKKLYATSANWK